VKLLLDSSVWLAWMRTEEEPNHEAARAILERGATGEVQVRLLDLTLYELGNVLIRAWGQSAARADELVASAIAVAQTPPLVPSADERRSALELAAQLGLSVYDATYGAVARSRRLTLVSGDRRLQEAGLAISPAAA
jgi:predicted nucleic acid-binding protein